MIKKQVQVETIYFHAVLDRIKSISPSGLKRHGRRNRPADPTEFTVRKQRVTRNWDKNIEISNPPPVSEPLPPIKLYLLKFFLFPKQLGTKYSST